MKIKIDSAIFEKHPKLLVGVIVLRGIDNSKRRSVTEQFLNGICAQIQKNFTVDDLNNEPAIEAWRKTYREFGANPKKYPSSIEALMKRVIKGSSVPSINTLVDVYNYISLKNRLPIGGEDLDKLCGDVCLTYAEGNDPFIGIGSTKVAYVPKGEVIYRDDAGVTCRRWNYRECDRSKLTTETKNACLILEDMGVLGEEKLANLVEETAQFVTKYVGGEATIAILNAENSEIETGVDGQTGINDDPEAEKNKMEMEVKQVGGVVEAAEKAAEAEEKADHPPATTPEKPKKNVLMLSANWQDKLKDSVNTAVEKAYPEVDIEINVDYPRDTAHGDYAANAAMIIGKKLGQNPREVAEKLVETLGKVPGVEKLEIAGPGFINFFLSNTTLNNEINKAIQKGEEYGVSTIGDGETVIVEYSQPNVAKPLGVHHLLSTIIGQVITNMYKAIGYYSVSVNHIGDWGTQFGKLIHAYKTWGDRLKVENEGIMGLLELYVKFHDEVEAELAAKKEAGEENPTSELEDMGRAEFKKLEDGDEENMKLWQWFIEITMAEIKPIYERLNVYFNETIGESFYSDKMDDILEMGIEKGIFKEGEKGALICEFADEKIPTCLVRKADGASLYATRDLATVRYRVERWKPQQLIYAVDVAQSLHFTQFFEIAKMLGLSKDTEMVHVKFGRMSLPDKQMSTRKGNVVLMSAVLDEAVERAKKIIAEKSPDLSPEEQDDVAEKVGIGAIKYNILSQNRNTNITFEWDKMLAFEGNSGPYLQYTTARAHSILRKVGQEVVTPPLKDQTSMLEYTDEKVEEPENDSEVELKRMFVKYQEALLSAAQTYKPNTLTNYLFELAKAFNNFYNNSRVIGMGPETEARRVKLVKAALQVLENGLNILGVDPLKKM